MAGGPSARGIDLSQLHTIIAVNGSYLSIYPHPCVGVVSIDRDFMAKHSTAIAELGFASLFLSRVGEHPCQMWAKCRHFDVLPGLSEHPLIAHTGGSSGAAALNIAYHMRPRFIGLIGFDYDASGRHWYDERSQPTNSRETWARWAAHYDTTAAQLQARGIEVANFSESSRITAFRRAPFATIAKYLATIGA